MAVVVVGGCSSSSGDSSPSTGPGSTAAPIEATALVAVPSLVGMATVDANRAASQAGLTTVVTEACNPNVPAGIVYMTDPPAGHEVPKGATVPLSVSSGPCLG